MDLEEYPHTQKRPFKPSAETKKHVPAPVKIRLPKGLYESAALAGNYDLVDRSAEKRLPPIAPGARPPITSSQHLIQTITKSVGHITLSPPVSIKRREHRFESFYDPSETGVFPPSLTNLHALEDYDEEEGGDTPDSNPLCWVPTEKSSPAMQVRPQTAHIPTKTSTTMPLEYFDGLDMEVLQPEKRLLDKPANAPGVLAYSRFYDAHGGFTWSPCWVLEYDRPRDMYKVVWHSSDKMKMVKRLNLFFDNESKHGFKFRLRQARRRKEEMEQEARYYEYVARQPFKNIDVLTEAYKQIIISRAMAKLSPALKKLSDVMFEDFRENFKFAVKAAVVDQQFLYEDTAAHLAACNVQAIHLKAPVPYLGCVNLKTLRTGTVVAVLPSGETTVYDLPAEEFPALLSDLQHISYIAKDELLAASQTYFRELDLRPVLLVDVSMEDVARPCRLTDFLKLQHNHMEEAHENLAGDWTIKVGRAESHTYSGLTALYRIDRPISD
jgi:hypothetical protein